MSAVEQQPEQPLCVHFVNTVDRHGIDSGNDCFSDFEGFLTWTGTAELLPKAQRQRWSHWGERHRSEANRFLDSLVTFREYLYDLLLKSALAQRVNPSKLAELNAMLSTPDYRRSLHLHDDEIAEEWECGEGLTAVLRRVALSAADVLLNDTWRKIVNCSRDDCDWVAIDTSRNHSRRYCTSNGCGNRERVQRHYRRHRADGTSPRRAV